MKFKPLNKKTKLPSRPPPQSTPIKTLKPPTTAPVRIEALTSVQLYWSTLAPYEKEDLKKQIALKFVFDVRHSLRWYFLVRSYQTIIKGNGTKPRQIISKDSVTVATGHAPTTRGLCTADICTLVGLTDPTSSPKKETLVAAPIPQLTKKPKLTTKTLPTPLKKVSHVRNSAKSQIKKQYQAGQRKTKPTKS